MPNTIQVRRGANASLPTLNAGEFGFSTDTHQVYIGDGAANHELVKTTQNKRYIEIRLLDKDTSHTVGAGVGGEFRLKVAMTVLDVGAYFDTAGTTSVTTIDINEDGTTILSTKITVDTTEKTSETAATPAVISDSAIGADAIITFDIDGIASGTAGKGLVVWMEVTIP